MRRVPCDSSASHGNRRETTAYCGEIDATPHPEVAGCYEVLTRARHSLMVGDKEFPHAKLALSIWWNSWKRIVQAKAYVGNGVVEWKPWKNVCSREIYIPSLTEGLRDLSIKGKTSATIHRLTPQDDFSCRRAVLKTVIRKNRREDLHGATCLCGLRSSYNDWRRFTWIWLYITRRRADYDWGTTVLNWSRTVSSLDARHLGPMPKRAMRVQNLSADYDWQYSVWLGANVTVNPGDDWR